MSTPPPARLSTLLRVPKQSVLHRIDPPICDPHPRPSTVSDLYFSGTALLRERLQFELDQIAQPPPFAIASNTGRSSSVSRRGAKPSVEMLSSGSGMLTAAANRRRADTTCPAACILVKTDIKTPTRVSLA